MALILVFNFLPAGLFFSTRGLNGIGLSTSIIGERSEKCVYYRNSRSNVTMEIT